MTRALSALPDWEIKLIAWARGEKGKLFTWGETNCVALALRALDAQCGSDLMSKYRRHMATETRALCWARKHGTAGVVERLLSDGCVAVEPAMIQVGDIALVDLPGNIGAAVCLGRTYLSSTLERGVAMFEPYHLAAPVSVLGVR